MSDDQIKSLQEFAKWVIRESAFQGCYLDGCDVQETAHQLGLLVKTTYDPEKHGPSDCADEGDKWYVFSDTLTASNAEREPFCWIPTATAKWLGEYDGPACATQTAVHNRPIKSDGGVPLYAAPLPLSDLEAENARLRERLAEALEALEPFASVALLDQTPDAPRGMWVSVPFGWLQDARRVREPAPAARSGGVKPLDEADYEDIVNAATIKMRKATSGARGQIITVQDGLDWWVMKETENRILAALEAAGFRIVGPGEVDKETVEKCAEVALSHANQTDYDIEPEAAVAENVTAKSIAATIRALGRKT